MKKKLCFILIMVMAISFTMVLSGCGKEDPIEAFTKASEQLNDAKDISADSTLSASMDLQGMKMEITGDVSLDYIAPKDDDNLKDLEMALKLKMSLMGETMNSAFYIKDNKAYEDNNGTKNVSALTDDDSIESLTDILKGDSMIDIKDYVKESSYEDDVILIKIKGQEYVDAAVKKLVDEQDMTAAEEKEFKSTFKNIDFNTITLKAKIDDNGNFTSLKTTCNLSFDTGVLTGDKASGEKSKMSVKMDIKEIKINSDLKIDYPNLALFK